MQEGYFHETWTLTYLLILWQRGCNTKDADGRNLWSLSRSHLFCVHQFVCPEDAICDVTCGLFQYVRECEYQQTHVLGLLKEVEYQLTHFFIMGLC